MKKVKILTITLIVILITMIAFGGIYVQKQNRMENKVADYALSMNLKGGRRIILDVAESVGEEAKTKENYQKAKDILENRLKAIGMQDYLIRLNEETGEMIVEIPEDAGTDVAVSYLGTAGKFEIKDKETEEVLMDNNDIKLSNVVYGQDQSSTTGTAGTVVYLNIEFTKDGAKKIEEISRNYKKGEEYTSENSETSATENETAENTEEATNVEANTESENNAESSKEKQITMVVDGNEIMTTNFEEPVVNGKLQLSIGRSSTDNKTLQGYVQQASSMATLLDNGNLPVEYVIGQNQYVESGVTSSQIATIIYVITAIVAVALLALIVKYKGKGAIATVAYIGLVSVFLILIRYTNVMISLEGILGIAIVLLLNYIFTKKLLDNELNIKETYKEFFIKIIPICIFAIVCAFMKWASISSLGMVMFWGIALIAIYNFIVTNNIMKISASK